MAVSVVVILVSAFLPAERGYFCCCFSGAHASAWAEA